MDAIKSLSHAFDPSWIAFSNDDPFLPLTFTTPTTNPCQQILCLPIAMPEPVGATLEPGLGARFTIPMLLKDPRRYLQTPVTLRVTEPLPIPVTTLVPQHRLHDVRCRTCVIHSTNTGTREGAQSIVFDLSSRANTDVVVLDFQTTDR